MFLDVNLNLVKMNYKEKDTILYLDNVSADYGGDYILRNITLEEKDVVIEGRITGQIVAVVGRSGRGKSTLFKLLTGLKKPSEGSVMITEFNTEISTDAKLVEEGDVGFVDQHYTLFRHKTVFDILMYAMRNLKKSKIEKQEVINSYLNKWGLSNQAKQYPNELSGGQRQRVAILEQVLSSSQFMVLDEPTSGLDVPGIENVKKAFRLIQETDELNTIIFCSHLIEFAVEMADVVYFIGQPEGETYSTIIKKFDLKQLGLAWAPYNSGHQKIVEEIKQLMQTY